MPTQTIHIPIQGMTCATCAATVERVGKKLGVDDVWVNFASEQAAVTFDPKAVALPQIVRQIQEAGYSVPTARVELTITGMSCVVELVPPRTLPRTSSGKLSRSKARLQYLSGEIQPFEVAA